MQQVTWMLLASIVLASQGPVYEVSVFGPARAPGSAPTKADWGWSGCRKAAGRGLIYRLAIA
jgi:hypothetical protein